MSLENKNSILSLKVMQKGLWQLRIHYLPQLQQNSQKGKISGLYYKTIMIAITTIVSDAPNCGVTYNRN
jgi:hypothetical protein